jgi:hypothetical protein
MAEAIIGALDNLLTATAADRGVVATLTEANSRLVKQLEDNSNELRELKDLIKKERFEKRRQRISTMDVSFTMMMKNAVKCDTNCDMQPLVNHHIFERILCSLDIPGSIPV